MIKPLWNPTQLTCQITIGDWPACEGVQKLIGFTRGLGFHRVDYFPYWHISNSIVLGYNRSENEDTVRIWIYGYLDGVHIQSMLTEKNVGEKLDVCLKWTKFLNAQLHQGKKRVKYYSTPIWNNTLPIGFLLYPYAEIDGPENKRTPFQVDIKDLKVNGKLIKNK